MSVVRCSTALPRAFAHHYLRRSSPCLYHVRHASTAPHVAQPGFWKSLIPKPFRSGPPSSQRPSSPSQQRPFNPFLIYVFIFILIGSNAINQIGLRNELTSFSRKTEGQLGQLREVIRRVQAGEEVDVEAMLGTGDPQREKEWEEVLAEVGGVDELYEKQLRRKEKKEAKLSTGTGGEAGKGAEEVEQDKKAEAEAGLAKKKTFGFY